MLGRIASSVNSTGTAIEHPKEKRRDMEAAYQMQGGRYLANGGLCRQQLATRNPQLKLAFGEKKRQDAAIARCYKRTGRLDDVSTCQRNRLFFSGCLKDQMMKDETKRDEGTRSERSEVPAEINPHDGVFWATRQPLEISTDIVRVATNRVQLKIKREDIQRTVIGREKILLFKKYPPPLGGRVE
jgi:hypothetical protein